MYISLFPSFSPYLSYFLFQSLFFSCSLSCSCSLPICLFLSFSFSFSFSVSLSLSLFLCLSFSVSLSLPLFLCLSLSRSFFFICKTQHLSQSSTLNLTSEFWLWFLRFDPRPSHPQPLDLPLPKKNKPSLFKLRAQTQILMLTPEPTLCFGALNPIS